MLFTRFCFPVLSLAGLLALLVLSASALASPTASYVLGPDSPSQTVHLQWPDGGPLSVTLRVHSALPSYVPASVSPGTGATYQVNAWGSNPRTMTFSHPAHADDIVVQWSYDPSYVDPAPTPDASYVLGPDSPSQEVHLQWPDGDPLTVTLRVHNTLPSYVPGSVSPGTGASYAVSAWGNNPRTMTFSHPTHADDIVVQWSYDPNYVAPNQAPTVTGVLEVPTLTIGGAAVAVNAAGVFTDPDGETLVYSAASDTPAVVSVMMAEAIVSLEGVAAGVATVTVTAQDPAGEAASVAVEVTVEESVTADLLVDTNRDGRVDAADEKGEDVWTSASGAVFGPNLDDDDEDGLRDWEDVVVNGKADLLDMAPVVVRRMPGLTEQHTVSIELDFEVLGSEGLNFEGMTSVAPRLFLQHDETSFELLINGEAHSGSTHSATLAADALRAGDVQLFIESALGRTHGFDGNLTLVLKVEEGSKVIAQDEVALRGSPVLLSHHQQSAERLFVANVPSGIYHNQALVGALETGLPDSVDLYKFEYKWDRWTQDFMQTGYVQWPSIGGVETEVVHVQLNRRRGFSDFLSEDYLAPDTGYVYPARGASGTSMLDYGGNVEVIPPHTHDGKEYPLGRIVIGGPMGAEFHESMTDAQLNFFNAQEVQAPVVVVPSAWLLVGHIDEIFLIVSNPNAGPDERPWSIVIASPVLAIRTLQEATDLGHGDAEVFKDRLPVETTVDALLADSNLMDFNDYAQGIIDTVRETLKSEIGLTDADFREIPALYRDDGGQATALMPAMQNLVSADTVLFVPDPEGPEVDGVDIWQEEMRKALDGLGLEIQFVDVFYSYHMLHGSAHCGTNIEREGVTETPWWTVDGEQP